MQIFLKLWTVDVCVYIALRDVVTEFKTDVMKMDSTSVSLQNTC